MTYPMLFDVWAFMTTEQNRVGVHFVTPRAKRFIIEHNSAAAEVIDGIIWFDYPVGINVLQEYQAEGLTVAFDGGHYDN